jgi:DNA-binding PadR family transcriptional regulator
LNNSWANIDLRALVENLRESISALGGFSPEQVRAAASLGEDALQTAILLALKPGALTGHEIIQAIEGDSRTALKPKAAAVYPMLEKLADLGLVSSELKKDRKKYTLTAAGKEAATAAEASASNSATTDAPSGGSNWGAPNWVDLRGELPNASKRLAKVALEVAQHGTKEQQSQAAAAIDEARRKLHEILASE